MIIAVWSGWDMTVQTMRYSSQGLVVECYLVPDETIVPKRGTLRFQVTATNNTDTVRTALFATKVTKADGNWYPPSVFLCGPNSHSFEPYESKSWHKTHIIPLTVLPGTYTYHGYVGNYGVGNYSECTFDFEVIPSVRIESVNSEAESAMALPCFLS
jgi:hypothetical protein